MKYIQYIKNLREMNYPDLRIERILDISHWTLVKIDNGESLRDWTIAKIEKNYDTFMNKIKNY